MDERMRFIVDRQLGEWSMTELCERYGISRKTGYKWLDRYAACGVEGLAEGSHAPLAHGRATAARLAEAIIGLRRERPSWAPRKIVAKLASGAADMVWPSASTAGEILKRAGLVTGRRLKRRAPPRLGELTVPRHANHVWAVDHKGWVRLADGKRVEPLTMTDGFSRYLIGLAATSSTAQAEARPLFEKAFQEYGLPELIRSDNGAPFASSGPTGLTELSAWWIKLGIRHERIDPGQPQQNGRHERFHLTLLEAMRPAAACRAAQARRFQAFTRDYNEERPHEALGQRTPASFYQRSPRSLPRRLPEPAYPAEAAVRRVRSNGEIKWQGDLVHICSALAGEAVAVEETETGDWQVRFFDRPIGVIDLEKRKLRRPAPGAGRRKAPNHEKLSPIHPVRSVTSPSAGQRNAGLAAKGRISAKVRAILADLARDQRPPRVRSRQRRRGVRKGRELVAAGELRESFQREFGRAPRLFRAPGRINLIGEHTDYNAGFVLPAALELSTWTAAAARDDRKLRIHSLHAREVVEHDLEDPSPNPRRDWSDYVSGVAVILGQAGKRLVGADLMIDSDVPIGAGLSSSAALEVSAGYALLDCAGIEIDLTQLALFCQRAENEFVGMRCGIMDQFIACRGAAGHALLLDCRSLAFRLTPIAPSVRLVICNSLVHHAHAGGEYNKRRADCEQGVAMLARSLPGIRALRDVSIAQLEAHRSELPERIFRRCRHIITENDRVERAGAALEAGDTSEFGRLMIASHASMRDDYEISCRELDILVEIARRIDGVLGSRMTGGGFGGCSVNMVRAEAVERFSERVAAGYFSATGIAPQVFVGSPGAGVGVVGE